MNAISARTGGVTLAMPLYFSGLVIDLETRELRDKSALIALAPKAFDVLAYLVTHRDRVVTKGELLDEFWTRQTTESVLQSTIRLIRQAVSDNGREQKIIRTYFGRGFRFVHPVTKGGEGDKSQPNISADFQERRIVAVMTCRLSTSGDPSTERLRTLIKQGVSQHDGVCVAQQDHAVTAIFGATPSFEDGVRRAVLCAHELQAHLGPDRSLSVGIDAGPMILADVAQTSDALDPPQSVLLGAAHLSEQAVQNSIVLGQAAYDQVASEIDVSLTNSGGYELRTILSHRAGVLSRLGLEATRFVGRRAELGMLQDRLAQTLSEQASDPGQGQAVILSGQAGIGKSRLLAEFLSDAVQAGARPLVTSCLPRLRNTPLAPLGALIRSIAGPKAEPDLRAAAQQVIRSQTDSDLLAELLSDDALPSPTLSAMGPEARKRSMFDLVFRLLSAICHDHVVIVAFEDLHWMDITSRACLDFLFERLDQMRLFVVATTRPGAEPPTADWVPVTHLPLPPLYFRDSVALVRSVPGLATLTDEDAAGLAQRAAGNPFFLEELSIAYRADHKKGGPLPQTVQAVLASRFADLDAPARRVLQVASVVGGVAPRTAMRHLAELDDGALNAAFGALRTAGFLGEDADGAFRFRHVLIQDAAYDTLTPSDRAGLNRAFAIWLEEGHLGASSRQPERLAWHYQQARDTARAISYWQAAGSAAYRRSAYIEAIEFARNGLDLLVADPKLANRDKQELDLMLILAPALVAARGYAAEDVGQAYKRARDLAATVAPSRIRFRILVGLWNFEWVRGDLGRARDLALDMVALAEAEQDVALTMRAQACLGEIDLHLGDVRGARQHLAKGIALYSEIGQDSIGAKIPAVGCYSYAAWAAQLLGDSQQALSSIQTAESLARQLEHPLCLALTMMFQAELFLMQDVPQKALDAAKMAASISQEQGFPFWHGSALVVQGWAEGQLGDTAKGLETIRQGIRIFEETGARVQLANWNGLLAETLLLHGDAPEARGAVERGLDWADETTDRFFAPRLHVVAARICRKEGDETGEQFHSDMARQQAETQGVMALIDPILSKVT